MRGLEIIKWLLRFLLILGIPGKWHPQRWESLDSPRVLHCHPNTNVSLPFVLLWSLLCSTPIQGRKLKECGDRERKGGRVARGTKCRWWRVWARHKNYTHTLQRKDMGEKGGGVKEWPFTFFCSANKTTAKMYEALVLGLAPCWMCHMGYLISFSPHTSHFINRWELRPTKFAPHLYLRPFRLLYQSTIDWVAYKQQRLISHNLEARSLLSRFRTDSVWWGLSSGCRLPILTVSSHYWKTVRELSGAPFIRILIPFVTASPSWSNQLPNAHLQILLH